MSYTNLPQDISQSSTVLDLPTPQAKGAKAKLRRLLPIMLLIAGIGFGTWHFSGRRAATDAIQLSGRLEGYETDIGAKIGGRVKAVAVREGDRVHKGQVIAELDDQEILAQLQGVTARLAAAKQQEQQALFQIGVIQNQIQEAKLNRQQSQDDAQGQILKATSTAAATEAQLSQIRAEYSQAEATVKLAKLNRDRYAQLVQEGAVSQQKFDEAQTAWETSQAVLEARRAAIESAKRQVRAAQGELAQAETSALNPEIRTTQVEALRQQLAVAQSQRKAAHAEVNHAEAAREEVLAQMAYLRIVSPIDGVAIARSVEPGAVVGSGRTLLTVIDPKTVYLRGYVPEGEIGKIRVGQAAEVFLDSSPNQALEAHVGAIDTEASFTPENIYFYQDRVKQTFGIKINIDQPGGFAKPGMPAEAEIHLK
jgi:HlyD family secretion protein